MLSPGAEPVRAENALGLDQSVFVVRRDEGCERRPTMHHAVTHDYLVVAFCTRGAVVIEQEGRWALEPGDALLIPAGAAHRHLEASDSETWCLGLRPVCFLAEGDAELLEPFDRVRAGAAAVVRIPALRRMHLEVLFRELQREVEQGGSGTLTAQRSLVALLLTEVGRAMSSLPALAAPSSVVTDALRFIERHCTESISLQDVADAVHRSPAYVTTLVRRGTGRSVQAWIIAGRLAEARRRLRHTDEMVEVIAERIGYADATHFIRLFRRAHGTTPAAWRIDQRNSPTSLPPIRRLPASR